MTSGNYVTVTATPPDDTDGSFKLRLKATSVRSGGSTTDNAPASAVTSDAEDVDNTETIATVATAAWSNITGGTTLSGRITFSGAGVTNIGTGDFSVLSSSDVVQTGWSISVSPNSVSAGNYVTVSATPPANTNARFKLRLDEESVRSGGSLSDNAPADDVDSTAATVNNVVVTPTTPTVATASWDNLTGGTELEGDITFSGADVTGISDSDFSVLTSSNGSTTGWTISVSNTTVSDGGFSIVTGSPPADTNGSFKFRLSATSVRSDGSSTDNAPALSLIHI